MLTTARDPYGPAPTDVPAFIRDAKDPFFKSNMALAFARGAARKTVVKKMEERSTDGRIDLVVKSVEAPAHEEVLDALSLASPEQVVDPASFFFTKAVAEYALMKKDAATSSVMRLLDDVADLPDRYRLVATLMFFDMTNWSPDPKDLTNIGRLMDNSGRRLDLTRPGDKTQDIQKKIVFRLDELIKQMENQSGGGGGQANGGACPNGGKPGNQPGAGNQPNAPMPDSMLGGQSGDGVVIEKKLREVAETWGTLPPEKRATIIQEMARDVPAKYKPVVDEYFKALNRTYGFKDK
jgi:hypothetical protein